MSSNFNNREFLTAFAKTAILSGFSYFLVSWLLKQLDPANNKQKRSAKSKGETQLKRLGKNKLNLTEHELWIASHLIVPQDIKESWHDVAGLEEVISELSETVIFPIKYRSSLGQSKLTRPPKGVLLYGPPGCGKTLIAKATAKEAAASFINLDISMLTDKWYGESQKLVAAVFSLAEKIQPCIIFIDEIDSLLRARSTQDHEATAMMKAQFMFLWDGLGTDSDKVVIVMGATNRQNDLDGAILRRMPATFRIPMPNAHQRIAILKLILEHEDTEPIDYDELVSGTDGFSGSDLQELCRNGSLTRIRELARSTPIAENGHHRLRRISMDDMRKAVRSMNNTRLIERTPLTDIKLD